MGVSVASGGWVRRVRCFAGSAVRTSGLRVPGAVTAQHSTPQPVTDMQHKGNTVHQCLMGTSFTFAAGYGCYTLVQLHLLPAAASLLALLIAPAIQLQLPVTAEFSSTSDACRLHC